MEMDQPATVMFDRVEKLAVTAGQVAPWSAVYPYGRKAFTPILERMAEALSDADPDVTT